MAQPVIQASFNAGEWAPQLNARVDLEKYHAGAALLLNFFVDYRGGASTRTGTQYILQAYKSATAVRLIRFQASSTIDYALEFGQEYLRFYYNKAPILEAPINISAVSQANPCQVTLGNFSAQLATPNNAGVSASYAPSDEITLAGGTFSSASVLGVLSTQLLSATVLNTGSTNIGYGYFGYSPGDTITLSGGTSSTQAQVRVITTQVIAAELGYEGSGGTPGTAVVTGTTGTGTKFQANVTINGSGQMSAVNSIVTGGSYTVNPTFISGFYDEPVTGGGLSNAHLIIDMGVATVSVINPGAFTANPSGDVLSQASTSGGGDNATFTGLFGIGNLSIVGSGAYSAPPTNPVSQASTTGTGAGATFNVTFASVGYNVGDWIYITGVGGMTQLNGQYYSISAVAGAVLSLADLNGNPINSTGYSPYTSGGTTARVYTITTPYAASDLALLKFSQDVNSLILTHPSYPVQVLTLISANDWTIFPAVFGSTATAPTGVAVATTLSSGSVNYSYLVTSVDSEGDESAPSTAVALNSYQDLRTTAGTNSISWNPVPGASSYNVYKSDVSYFSAIPPGVPYGFIGNCTGTSLADSNIAPDFSQTPPIAQNPFVGAAVESISQTSAGTYTAVPSVVFSGGNPNVAASASVVLEVQGTPTVGTGGSGYLVGDKVNFSNNVTLIVATESAGVITAFEPVSFAGANAGVISSGSTPSNPVTSTSSSGAGSGATANLTWGAFTELLNGGEGYQSTPDIVYDPTGATAMAILATSSDVYPGVCGFYQQRLVLCASLGGPQTMNLSQPGSYFNYDISNPIEADDAIEATLASGVLNTIKSLTPTSAGLIVLTDEAFWLVNGGSLGSAISPSQLVANIQSSIGANDMPPIVVNFDVLFAQKKGSVVRDATYNYYAQIFTGTDVSIQSSHLFYGYNLLEWAWAEEPYKLVYAIRNDGVMLTLTFMKEQDFIGWAHHNTQGLFKSVCTIIEPNSAGGFDNAVYTVVQRTINGNTIQYIERFADRLFTNGVKDAWCVDAGIQYVGSPTTTFSGATQLAGATVTGLADGVVIPLFTMPVDGEFTLASAASKVTVGLAFTPQLQTLALDTGQPTIQGKEKKINAVTVRCDQTLGLSIGSSFSTLTSMKDLVVGNVGSMTNQLVTDLVTGDARTFLDPTYTVPGQYCIQQSNPMPASVLGVIPQLAVGDTER